MEGNGNNLPILKENGKATVKIKKLDLFTG